jgi:hypothetical protein
LLPGHSLFKSIHKIPAVRARILAHILKHARGLQG